MNFEDTKVRRNFTFVKRKVEKVEFSFEMNRSERAKQAELLVPALDNPVVRYLLLNRLIPGITREETDNAKIMHFVWVLRDWFYYEREQAKCTGNWEELCERWAKILDLPEWVNNIGWWKHPKGDYKSNQNYVVHPCHRTIGWTKQGIVERVKRNGLKDVSEEDISTLIEARQVMNTECDCLIQTPKRLIVIECKDKTDFLSEQSERQKKLFKCLERLIIKQSSLIYIEVSNESNRNRPYLGWSWQDILAARSSV